jgi:3-oxo-5-alpha-steroid 4-dehydrogenase 1
MHPFLLLQFLLCPLVLLSLLRVTAPYGRHHTSGWGPNLSNRLAWMLMELPALLVITVMVMGSVAWQSPQAFAPLTFWVIHYSYRSFIFPALMHPSDKTFPVLLVLFAVSFNTLNGFNNAGALIANGIADAPPSSIHFTVGAALFMTGFCLHVHSDNIIRNLRKKGESGYKIPLGGLFRWVSSPHYLGEIIQWTGWAIMTWSLAGFAFALFTLCNLAPRAVSNHQWYKRQFEDYPVERRVLIPGVF